MRKKRYAIVVSSKTGNTAKLAAEITRVFDDRDCVYYGKPDDKALEADRLFIGFWTDKGTCDEDTLEFLKKVTDQEVFLFGTAGYGAKPEYFDEVIGRVKENLKDPEKILGSFMCQGRMQEAVKERYMKMKDSPEKVPNLDELIANYEKALTHPDRADIAAMTEALKAL